MNLEKNLKCIQLTEHVSVTALHCETFPLKSTPETLYVVKASYATSQNLHVGYILHLRYVHTMPSKLSP